MPLGLETGLTLDVRDELLAELPAESSAVGPAFADAPITESASPPLTKGPAGGGTGTPTTGQPLDPASGSDPDMATGPALQPRPHGDIEPFVPDGQMPILMMGGGGGSGGSGGGSGGGCEIEVQIGASDDPQNPTSSVIGGGHHYIPNIVEDCGHQATEYSWSVPSAFKNYISNQTKGELVPLIADDLDNMAVQFN